MNFLKNEQRRPELQLRPHVGLGDTRSGVGLNSGYAMYLKNIPTKRPPPQKDMR